MSCIGKVFKHLANIRRVASLAFQLYNFYLMGFLGSFKLLLAHCTVCYNLSMSSMLTIFDVSIKKRVYSSLFFNYLLSK